MKIPGWSALIIVPVVIFGSSYKTILQSENPTRLAMIAGISSLVIVLFAWALMAMLDKKRGR